MNFKENNKNYNNYKYSEIVEKMGQNCTEL
jgi:hypothetical protein